MEPEVSSSTSRIGSWMEPSCTVTFTFTSRTISRVFSSIWFGIGCFFGAKFACELDGNVVGIEPDGADKFWSVVEEHPCVAEDSRRHLDHVADPQARDLADRQLEVLPLGAHRHRYPVVGGMPCGALLGLRDSRVLLAANLHLLNNGLDRVVGHADLDLLRAVAKVGLQGEGQHD